MKIPVWLGETEYGRLPGAVDRRRKDYLERTLNAVQNAMAKELNHSLAAARSGLLQGINPRAKLVGMALVLVAAASSRGLAVLALIHVLLALAALFSRLGFKPYLLRVWLPAGVFAGMVMLPAIFNWITPGQPLLVIYQGAGWHFGPWSEPGELAITLPGLKVAALVMLRTAASLAVAVLLVSTTRWPVLTKALTGLGLPATITMVLDLTYRYLFLFLLLLNEYLLGRKSRLAGAERTVAKWEWIGGAVAGFLRLAGTYSQEVTAAMQARGYNGASRPLPDGSIRPADVVFLVLAALLLIMVWGGMYR